MKYEERAAIKALIELLEEIVSQGKKEDLISKLEDFKRKVSWLR